MYIDKNKKLFNPYARHLINGVEYQGNILQFPTVVAELGIKEIPVPEVPPDFIAEYYFITYQDDAPYVVYTKKSDEQIKDIKNSQIWNQIDSLERATQFPRQLRDFLLSQPEADKKGWYAKVKQVDDQIMALKGGLVK